MSTGQTSEGVRRAYAAARIEFLKSGAATGLFIAGIGMFLLNQMADFPGGPVGIVLAAIFVVTGLLTFRTTALWHTVQQGPRIPRRIRLPFDSVVEVTTMQIPVQQRTELVAVDKKPPEPAE